MSSPSHTVPPRLADRAFTLQEAMACGLTPSQLSRGPYDRVTRSVWQRRGRMVEADPATELRLLLPAVLAAHPTAMASHLTAGILLGLRLPRRAERIWPLHLMSSQPDRQLRGANITGHRAVALPDSPVLRAGLRCTGPARTVVDIASLHAGRRVLLTDDQLVAALDGMISSHRTGYHRGETALRDLEHLHRDLEALAGVPGVHRVRTAVQRCAPSVDSPLETRARLCLEQSGLTGWVTDLEVRAPGGGSFWPDLADPVHRLSIQVEGAVHDLRNQRVRDIRRERITAAAGWTEIRVSAGDIDLPHWAGPDTVAPIVQLVLAARGRARREPMVTKLL